MFYFLSWTSLVQSNICLGLSTLLLFSCSVLSNSLWPHGLQHARPPSPSLSPRVCSNLYPLSQWCHPTISSSVVPFPPAFNLSQHQGLPSESALHIRWPKYWSFSFNISPSNDDSGLFPIGLTLHKTISCFLFSSYCRVFSFHCILKHPYKRILIWTLPSFGHTSARKPTLAHNN